MIILPLFIYLVLTFVYIIISFYLTDFIIRCFLGWEYSVDDEKKHAVYDGGGAAYGMSVKIKYNRFHEESSGCGKWRTLDGVDSLEQEETIQDTRN